MGVKLDSIEKEDGVEITVGDKGCGKVRGALGVWRRLTQVGGTEMMAGVGGTVIRAVGGGTVITSG